MQISGWKSAISTRLHFILTFSAQDSTSFFSVQLIEDTSVSHNGTVGFNKVLVNYGDDYIQSGGIYMWIYLNIVDSGGSLDSQRVVSTVGLYVNSLLSGKKFCRKLHKKKKLDSLGWGWGVQVTSTLRSATGWLSLGKWLLSYCFLSYLWGEYFHELLKLGISKNNLKIHCVLMR